METKLKAQIESMKLDLQQQKLLTDTLRAISEQVEVQAAALKLIREAIGVDGIMDPQVMLAFRNQARELNETIMQQ